MTDRDLPPEQPGYPPSEGDPRDTGAHAAEPPAVPGWPPLPASGGESAGAHAQTSVPPPPPPWPGRTPEVPSPAPRSDAAPPWGQHAQSSESEAVESTSERPAAAPQESDPGAPYRPSDVETTTFFDRRDFPPPPLRESPSGGGSFGETGAGQHAVPPSSPQWGGEPPRHQAPPFPQQSGPQRPPSPAQGWPGERSAPPAGDPRQPAAAALARPRLAR